MLRTRVSSGLGRYGARMWSSSRVLQYGNGNKSSPVARVRGTRDLLPLEAEKHRQVVGILQQVVDSYGFRQIQTPLMEYTNLFGRSLGGDSDIVMKEMYTFEDKSGKSVTLRPEGTAGIIRALVSNNLKQELPMKLSYSGSMYRYERPQRGRYREFQQFGAEYLGSSGPSVDIEVIAMAAHALDKLQILDKVQLQLNSLGDVDSRANYREALTTYFERFRQDLSADSISRLERGSVLRILDSKDRSDQAIVENAPRLIDYLTPTATQRMETVLRGLDAMGIPYEHNSRLVRGLDYYSHTVFEFVEQQEESDGKGQLGIAVLAGGCYTELSSALGGPDIDCIGWAAGVDRLCLLAQGLQPPSPSLAVVPVLSGDDSEAILHRSMDVAERLRRQGHVVHFCHGRGNLKKQMKAAAKLDSTHAIILGGDELANDCVKVKDMNKREEVSVSLETLTDMTFE